MTSIWENDDGSWQTGCGCRGKIEEGRFVVTEPCKRHKAE